MTKIDFSKMEGHTPGPWEWGADDGTLFGRGGVKVAWASVPCDSYEDDYGIDLTESDAKIIAAAPAMKDEIIRQRAVIDELVMALMHKSVIEQAADMLPQMRDVLLVVADQQEAAIKKAKGE